MGNGTTIKRRGAALLAAGFLALSGVAAAGCDSEDDINDQIDQAQEDIQNEVDQASEDIQKEVDEANLGFEAEQLQDEAQQQLDDAQEQLEQLDQEVGGE
jgi:F0F1-type ATP synthase membrane subunit b/b'